MAYSARACIRSKSCHKHDLHVYMTWIWRMYDICTHCITWGSIHLAMRPLVLSVWSSYSCGAQWTLTSRVHDVWSRDLRRTSVIMDLTRVPSVIVYLLLVMERWHVSTMSVKSIILFSLFSTVVFVVCRIYRIYCICCILLDATLVCGMYETLYSSVYAIVWCCIWFWVYSIVLLYICIWSIVQWRYIVEYKHMIGQYSHFGVLETLLVGVGLHSILRECSRKLICPHNQPNLVQSFVEYCSRCYCVLLDSL